MAYTILLYDSILNIKYKILCVMNWRGGKGQVNHNYLWVLGVGVRNGSLHFHFVLVEWESIEVLLYQPN